MAAKKIKGKKTEDSNPIQDYLDRREQNKYGSYVNKGEANYMPGDMSKANRAYRETGIAVRSTLEQLKSFMGGGLRKHGR